MKEQTPPEILYHGTAERNIKAILEQGIIKGGRNHVHLSADTDTARKVGMRYGKPFIFEVNALDMNKKGFTFYLSENEVWLTDVVPPEFLKTDLE